MRGLMGKLLGQLMGLADVVEDEDEDDTGCVSVMVPNRGCAGFDK
ncbi:MAG: hypothetical protein Q8K52_00175 [Thiobacillus sp.]|nr:hypothetical protein [Thiobacillus sp.]